MDHSSTAILSRREILYASSVPAFSSLSLIPFTRSNGRSPFEHSKGGKCSRSGSVIMSMSPAPSSSLRSLILSLYDVGAVKFGNFTLKSGVHSPYYLDLRLTVSYPKLLEQISTELLRVATLATYDVLCGVPYTALPFATVMSIKSGVGMVMRRKEAKGYGLNRLLEGKVKEGDICLVVEDLVTSGGSVVETINVLENEGLDVEDCVVVVDREQGGVDNLAKRGVNVYSVMTVTSMLNILVEEGRVEKEMKDRVERFIMEQSTVKQPDDRRRKGLTFGERVDLIKSPMGKKLLKVMARKRTCLAVAADVSRKEDLLKLANDVGPEICILKTHADIVSDWDAETGRQLRELADEHDFLIFEDRKFADIGNTVVQQCTGGFHRIAEWADIINAHSVPGPGIVMGLKKAGSMGGSRELGLALLGQMSSEGNLATALKEYTPQTVKMAKEHSEFVFGFISMGKIAGDEFLYLTPGVKADGGGDSLGQQYNTPAKAMEKGSDVIIVGRGIYKADDPRKAAAMYREESWKAYLERCGKTLSSVT